MEKYDFLRALEDALFALPEKDRRASIEYYSESIADRMEDGMTEAEAVSALGSVEDIAKQILLEQPLPALVKAKVKPKRSMRFWEILLLCLGFPVWFPVMIAVFAVILAIYIVLWAIVFALYAADFCIGVCGFGVMLGGFVLSMTGRFPQGLFLMGAGLVCSGIAVFLFMGCNLVAKGIAWISKKIMRGIKFCFIRKGDKS